MSYEEKGAEPDIGTWSYRTLNADARPGAVAELIRNRSLRVFFQPIAALRDGEIFAYEALIRGPKGDPLEYPDAMFACANREGTRVQLELECIQAALTQICIEPVEGHLFLNLSGKVLYDVARDWGTERLVRWFEKSGVPLSKLVIEITEHDRVSRIDQLKPIVDALRARGIGFALDDFGDGHSSLRLWAEIQPSFVKIDKFFTADLATSSYKARTLKALGLLSEILGGTLVAEGIEDQFQLAVVRDLGIGLGQGYFLGRPTEAAATAVAPAAADAIASREIAVIAQSSAAAPKNITAERLVIHAPSVEPTLSNEHVLKLFQDKPELHAVAVVEGRRPVGLITRRTFMDNFTHGFHKELFARRPCSMFMDTSPHILEVTADLSTMIAMLTSADQRYLTDGFIVADAGIYLGIGTGEQLVRTVTEQRIEAARHANPLTFLPGNIPISEHIAKLIGSGNRFCAAYCDLNHFKPFNDQYGYWRGDEMIRLLAGVLVAAADNRLDFVGHVGGDDFVVLFQSADWEMRCRQIIATFNERARDLFDEEALQRGGIEAEDREGNPTFFPLTTLAIGAVDVTPGSYQYPEDVATAAATAKRRAKRLKLGFWR